jgi:two-component system cell cycle sensor histidine kinase/response regulator CckA
MSVTNQCDERQETRVRRARILVVEDERIVARSLRRQLTKLNYEVVGSVPSGEESVRLCDETRPDLVLMDICLEGAVDGIDAAATIRKRFQLPVVYLTAYSNPEILERAMLSEPFGYILKPYEERALLVVIETALHKHMTERRLQQREMWVVATIKSVGAAVVTTDNCGCITYMNPLAEHLTGWAADDALGRPVEGVVRLVPSNVTPPLSSLLAPSIQGDTSSRRMRLIARNSSETAIENSVALITDEQGVAVGNVVVFRDVTWQVHLENKAEQAKKVESIGQLAAGVAHAFNNLNTTVLGYSEIMLQGMKQDDPFRANAQEIQRAATRTATLTQKLLAFGRKSVLKVRSVDVNAVVSSLAQVIRHMQSGVQLDLRLESELGAAEADSDQLEEAVLILARNACDAMPHGGQLTIQTANVELGQDYVLDHPDVRPGPYALLTVSDNGTGMNENAVSHLFEPFFTRKASVGAGLGLSAIYGFVKQCDGDIAVESVLHEGTTFRVYLPRTIERAEPADST